VPDVAIRGSALHADDGVQRSQHRRM